MPAEVLDRGSEAPSRRDVLRYGTALLIGASVPQSVQTLFAQPPQGRETKKEKVDVSKLSANELLRRLSKKIPVKSEFGNDAIVEMYEAEDAERLLFIFPYVHALGRWADELPGWEPPGGSRKYIEGSGNEIVQVVKRLHDDYGLGHVGLEGFYEDESKERMGRIERVRELRKNLRVPSIRRSHDELVRQLQKGNPFHELLDLEIAGNLTFVPIEDRKANEAARQEILEAARGKRPENNRITLDNRDDITLRKLDAHLEKAGAKLCSIICGGHHFWINEEVHLPNRIAVRNLEDPFTPWSAARITVPASRAYEEELKKVPKSRSR